MVHYKIIAEEVPVEVGCCGRFCGKVAPSSIWNYFITEGNRFESLQELVQHYQETDKLICRLIEPFKEKQLHMDLYHLPQLSNTPAWDIVPSDLTFDNVIGKGHFGEVWEGRLNSLQIASKVIPVSNIKQDSDFMQEVDVMKQIRHRYVLTLYG